MNIPEIVGWAVMILLSLAGLTYAGTLTYIFIGCVCKIAEDRRAIQKLRVQVFKTKLEALSAAVDVLEKHGIEDHESIRTIRARIIILENNYFKQI